VSRVQLISPTPIHVQHPSNFYSGVAQFLQPDESVASSVSSVCPITSSPILGKQGPRILATIENMILPILLDTGADVSVMSRQQMDSLVRPNLGDKSKSVNCFGGTQVLLEGPRCLRIELCGVSIVHPFYVVDKESPIILGFDAMSSARIVLDTYNKVAYSHYNFIGTSCPDSDSPVLPLYCTRSSSRPRAPLPSSFDDHSLRFSSCPRALLASSTGDHHTRSSSCPRAPLASSTDDHFTHFSQCPRTLSAPCSASSSIDDPSNHRVHTLATPSEPPAECTDTNVKHLATEMVSTDTPNDLILNGVTSNSSTVTDLPEHLSVLYLNTMEEGDIDQSYATDLRSLLLKHQNTFAKSSMDLGFSTVLQHDIDTGDARPIRQQPRRPPLSARQAEDKIIDEMLQSGVIRPSTSPWASPVCLIKKPDNSYRFCIDYRKVNAVYNCF